MTLTKLYNYIRGFFPTRLPQGGTEFDIFVETIINTYQMPTMDWDSIYFVISTSIMRLDPTVAYKSKWYFVLLLRAAAAKQVAGAKFNEIKERQKQQEADRLLKAAEDAKLKEVTTKEVTSSEPAQQAV